jgi:hypothetical protein
MNGVKNLDNQIKKKEKKKIRKKSTRSKTP